MLEAPTIPRLRGLETWREYHLVYHGDRDLLLGELVRPLLREVAEGGWADRFYFVRYGFGGPHIRLRWRWTEGPESPEELLFRRAESFFAEWPSADRVEAREIRDTNRTLALVDPMIGPGTDYVLPNNSLHQRPLEIEVDRYGGPDLLEPSLDLFTLSSVHALRVLRRETPGGRLKTLWAQLLVTMAGALARHEDELVALIGYGPRLFGEDFDACAAQGDRVYESQSETFETLVRHCLTPCAPEDPAAAALLAQARRLSREVLGASRDPWYLAASHLHMSANRLGVMNPDEVYLSQLLRRAAESLPPEDLASWRASRDQGFGPSTQPGGTGASWPESLGEWLDTDGRSG